MTPERSDRLIELAAELVCRVRDVDPYRNVIWLETFREDWRDLLITLAAMVDPSVPLPVVLGWTFPLADAAHKVAGEHYNAPPTKDHKRGVA